MDSILNLQYLEYGKRENRNLRNQDQVKQVYSVRLVLHCYCKASNSDSLSSCIHSHRHSKVAFRTSVNTQQNVRNTQNTSQISSGSPSECAYTVHMQTRPGAEKQSIKRPGFVQNALSCSPWGFQFVRQALDLLTEWLPSSHLTQIYDLN